MSAEWGGRWHVPADHSGLAALQAQANTWLTRSGVGAHATHRILLALDELAANIIEHAVQGRDGHAFEVCLQQASDGVELLVIDNGPAFDPTAQPAPTSAQSLDGLPIGGLGLLLVRRLADAFEYRRVDQSNRLRLRFRTQPVAAPPAG